MRSFSDKYRVGVNPWVKDSVCVLYWNLHSREERGRKGGNSNLKTKNTEPLTQEITPLLYVLVVKIIGIKPCNPSLVGSSASWEFRLFHLANRAFKIKLPSPATWEHENTVPWDNLAKKTTHWRGGECSLLRPAANQTWHTPLGSNSPHRSVAM